LVGYGCLLLGLSGGLLGGAALVFAAVARIVRGSEAELADTADAVALSLSLEGAVVAAGAGTLLLLIGVVCGVVLLKELADEAARKRRGPV
jgi:chromate transport protein ChrA